METIFFISLGITFVLILLLVYHFKQRISTIEQKTDTMLEIINNIVKEIYILKNTQQINNRFFTTNIIDNENISHAPSMNVNYVPGNKINVSDNDESDTEDEEDDSSDSEDDEVENNSDEDESVGQELKVEDIVSYEILPSATEDVKVINVSLNEIDVPIEDEPEPENEGDDITEVSAIGELDPSPIQVEKIDTEEQENLEEDASLEESAQKENSKDVYRKMTLQSLKALVITKGLCSDPSKLKKQELLKMLESVDE
jgi:hypothetical protein